MNDHRKVEKFEFTMASTKPVCIVSLVGDLTYKNKKDFEKLLAEIIEREESHYIIQCRDIGEVDQLGIQFLGRIYATLKNVRKDKFAFCSVDEGLKVRLLNSELYSKEKFLINLKNALNTLSTL